MEKRFLPLSGFVSIVLVALSVGLVGSTPGSDEPGAKVASYYDAHQARVFAAAFVLAAAAAFLVFFAVGLASALWPSGGEGRPAWQLVLVAGSVLAAAAFLFTGAVTFALSDVPDKLSGGALQALNVLSNDTWLFFNSGLGVMMLGAAGSLLPRTGAFRVLGWVALVLGIALFIPFADFFALLATGLWVIMASVVLARNAREPAYAAVPRVA